MAYSQEKLGNPTILFVGNFPYIGTMDSNSLFRAALSEILKDGEWGGKSRLAEQSGVDSGSISHFLSKKRGLSDHSKFKIAEAVGYTYEEMLAMGRRILNGNFLKQDALTPPGEKNLDTQAKEVQGNNRVDEYIKKTARIITSKTIYKSALERNIDAFFQAVETEAEMNSIREQITRMETKHKEDMDELKQLILALSGAAPQKREAASKS